ILALEDLALYDNERWNDPRDFAKPVKAIALPQDVPSTSDRRLIKLETQVQRLMEARLASTQPTQVNKITTSCEICSGPHDTRYCMENPEQAFVDFASSHIDEARGCPSLKPISNDNKGGPKAVVQEVEYFDTFPTRSELAYHKYLMCGPIPSIFLPNPIIIEGCQSNLKIPCNIGHVHVEKAYIDLNSPLNIMTRMMYNSIMRRKLDPRENVNAGISNFIGRIKGMHVYIGNFTYVVDFMIVDDISSIIDPRLSQVVLGRPFIKISNMTHDLPKGVVRFTNENDEVAYKIPYKIEQYNSSSDLEKEHTKSVYLRNKEDKRRGVDYVMSKILGFYKECLELGPEYVTGMNDEGEVTFLELRSEQSHMSIPSLRMYTCGLRRLFWSIEIGIKLYECTGSVLNSRTCFCDASRDRIQLDGIGGNTRTGLILERKDKDLTDLHQNLLKNDANRAWRRRRDLSSDNVMDLTTTSERSRLKPALEDSTWRRRHDYNTTSS
ncbi:retrotransposon ORF1, partial [Tanacetum coccineum]